MPRLRVYGAGSPAGAQGVNQMIVSTKFDIMQKVRVLANPKIVGEINQIVCCAQTMWYRIEYWTEDSPTIHTVDLYEGQIEAAE